MWLQIIHHSLRFLLHKTFPTRVVWITELNLTLHPQFISETAWNNCMKPLNISSLGMESCLLGAILPFAIISLFCMCFQCIHACAFVSTFVHVCMQYCITNESTSVSPFLICWKPKWTLYCIKLITRIRQVRGTWP